MYEIAQQVKDWTAQGREVTIGTVVATTGFSSREPGVAAAWTTGEPMAGRLIGALGPEHVAGHGLVQVAVSTGDAAAAGLSCGGTASVLVQPATSYPHELWDRLLAREPVCLVTSVPDAASMRTELYTPTTLRELTAGRAEIARLFGRGSSSTVIIAEQPTTVAIALWPVPNLVVVGDGLIADALRDAATLLGWTVQITPRLEPALDAIRTANRGDAVLVLSHDRAVDGPALDAALDSGAGYVGALGARHTQAARREWLTEHGVPADAQARIHGPAGLDIGAHTPAEIAVSIVAEIVANRSGADGRALRDRQGPVHLAGVNGPPPRY